MSEDSAPLRLGLGQTDNGSVGGQGARREGVGQQEGAEGLAAQKGFLSEVLSSITDGISVLDKDYRIVRVNRTMEQWYAHQMPLVGKKCHEAYHGQAKPCETCATRRTWETGEIAKEVVPRIGPGGEVCGWLDLHSFPLRDGKTGAMKGVIEYVRDITEQRRAEEGLQESEERFRQMAENIGEVFWLYDVASRGFLYVSPAYEVVFGRSVAELYRRAETWTEAVHAEDAARVHFHFAREQEGIPFESQYRIVRPDGGVRWIKDRGFAVTDETGQVYRLAGIAEDITERKQARRALEASEEKYRGLYEGSRDGIAFAGMDGRIQEANQAFLDMVGYTLEEVRRLTFWDITPAQWHAQQMALVDQVIERGYSEEYEKEYAREDGSVFPVTVRTWLVRDNEGRPLRLWAIVRDITEQKQAERERERLRGALEAKNEELESLIHATGHDLRSPLVNVEGFSRHLEKYCERLQRALEGQALDAKAKADVEPLLERDIPEAIYYVRASVRKMNALINGLLQLSRVGRAALRWELLDMDALVGEIRASMEYQLEEGQAALEVASLPACRGDREQISQVFSNLLDNALKYRDTSRPGWVSLSGSREGEVVVYRVADNGVGIPAGRENMVFQLFHREHSGQSEGEGVGLTIAQKIVERHGGRIWAESEAGKGSRFFVELPAGEQEG